MTLQEYWDLLDKYDWYFNYSDDYTVWKKGSEQGKKISALAKGSNERSELLLGFRAHYFNGKDKPARPA